MLLWVNVNQFQFLVLTFTHPMVHVTDLADAHYRAMKYLKEKKQNLKFNLGNGEGYSVLEIINVIERVLGIYIDKKIVGRREGDPARLISSLQKAREVLNWNPKYNLEHNSAWAWHIKNMGNSKYHN